MVLRFIQGIFIATLSFSVLAQANTADIQSLKKQVRRLESKVNRLENTHVKRLKNKSLTNKALTVHTLKSAPDQISFEPAALMAGDYIFTYIAGMPVVTSPYLGARPAFDGSDLIVNVSSINQDMRLMLQRRALYRALHQLGYPDPDSPIVAISGAIEPYAMQQESYAGQNSWDMDLNTTNLDVAAALNPWVEGYFSFAYDSEPPFGGGQRLSNSTVRLNKSFINVGNLDESPFYMTAGQFYVPFGRFASSMVSSPLTLRLARTKARAVLIGYKPLTNNGFYGSIFAFRSDTTNDPDRGAGGANIVYEFDRNNVRGEIGASYTSSLNDSGGMQRTGFTWGGFGTSAATEAVDKRGAFDVHANVNIGAYAMMAEWVTPCDAFRATDLAFNSRGARPQAFNVEFAHTFKVKSKPASVAVGYSGSKQALALGIPRERYSAVFNISLWRNTVQSLEYRHDVDYGTTSQAQGRGSAAVWGTGGASNTFSAQFGLYF